MTAATTTTTTAQAVTAATKAATTAPRPALTAEQRVIRDFRCYARRQIAHDLAGVLTPKQVRIVRDLINRTFR